MTFGIYYIEVINIVLLCQEVVIIKDQIIKILDGLPDEELENVYWAVKHIEKKYQFKWNLFGKGVKIENLFDESEKIIACWENTFAGNISQDAKNSIYYEQFRWHIFSYEIQPCISKDAAKDAFDSINKDELYMMYQNSPYVTMLSNASAIKASDFDNEQDVYIFDKSFAWTYVRTHESMCGPYFTFKHAIEVGL